MLNFSNHASLDAWQPLAEIKVAPPTPTPGSESTCMCWFVHVTVGSLREGRKVRMKGKHFQSISFMLFYVCLCYFIVYFIPAQCENFYCCFAALHRDWPRSTHERGAQSRGRHMEKENLTKSNKTAVEIFITAVAPTQVALKRSTAIQCNPRVWIFSLQNKREMFQFVSVWDGLWSRATSGRPQCHLTVLCLCFINFHIENHN